MTPVAAFPRLLLVLALLAPVEALDRRVQEAVQGARGPALEGTMGALSSRHGGRAVLAGLLAIAVFTGARGPATVRATLAALVPVNLAVEGLKWTVNRRRPDGEHRRSNASFPSSHAANAAALALVLGRRWPPLAIPLAVLAALVAFSRMYLNRHFLSDVLCGVVLGVGLAALTLVWLRRRGWGWEGTAPAAPRVDGPGTLC